MNTKHQIIFLLSGVISCCCNVSAQPMKSWEDTPTPTEILLHDAPYIVLQKEIENKLCDKDWEIDTKDSRSYYVAPFLMLNNNPNEESILRGTSIHHFSPVNIGIKCKVHLNPSSPLFKANNESMLAQSKLWQAQLIKVNDLIAKVYKNNNKFTASDSASMKKIKIASANATNKMAILSNERELASISMELNSKWTEVKNGRDYYLDGGIDFNNVKRLPPVAGSKFTVLFSLNPRKDLDPDTLYEAAIYIGNWPSQPNLMKRYAFHFTHEDKSSWTDKQHSGNPFLENIKIIILAEKYSKLMKVIHNIDWTKLEALIKK